MKDLKLPKELQEPIKHYCEANFIMPHDLFLSLLDEKTRQPFLIDADAVWGKNQTQRYLKTLTFLCNHSPEKFETAVKNYVGNERRLFAKTREEIERTGSSNKADKIPDTPWWASAAMSGYMKSNRISEVMSRMGFTLDYSIAVGWYPVDGKMRVGL